MQAKRYGILAAVVICVVLGAVLLSKFLAPEIPKGDPRGMKEPPTAEQKPVRLKAHLYFSDGEHRYLTAEERSLTAPDDVVDRAKALVYALIEGPESSLTRTVPQETTLRALHVTADGLAYVDFDQTIRERHPGGTLSELLTIYSVVNTLTLNIAEIKAVKILVEGREQETLAGHIDMRLPFQPDLLMIK